MTRRHCRRRYLGAFSRGDMQLIPDFSQFMLRFVRAGHGRRIREEAEFYPKCTRLAQMVRRPWFGIHPAGYLLG